MAHDVLLNLPEQSLGKADVEFKVREDGEVVGTLKISKGALVWLPKGASVNGYKLKWSDFDRLLQQHAKSKPVG